MKIFKQSIMVTVGCLLLATASCSFTSNEDDPEKDRLLVDLITYVIDKMHYIDKPMDDAFSSEVFDRYIHLLDGRKRYFLASDIEEFEEYRLLQDDMLKAKDLSFFNLTYNRLLQRIEESKAYYKEVLDAPFDFTIEESLDTEYENLAFATDKTALLDQWRKQLKLSVLASLYDRIEDQKMALENDPEAEQLTQAEMEEKARESTANSLEESYDLMDDLRKTDWFSMYMNAVLAQYDPHTSYYAPENQDRFNQQMSGKLEGIGARLQKTNDNIKIVEVISGGPAWRGEEIEVGDLITAVKQEDEEEAVSIIGMRLGDAVKLIKGPKGTKVTLTVKKIDGSTVEYVLTRDIVELEETYAKSSIVQKGEHKYGIIDLPKFYFDMDDYNSRNAASDTEIEIERLKQQGMDGLIIDLRNNGGGSLQTVVDIVGLFIKKGPVVQVGLSNGTTEVLEDKNEKIVWDGPLVILVNEVSASASEILAAAMQDYKRAIIIGSDQTFGKGTVQNVWDLNNWVQNSDYGALGGIKVTTQKFYRINGGSTQLEGVKSDVVVPDRYSYIDIGEKDEENPLPYDEIAPATYTTWKGYIDMNATVEASRRRMNTNPQIQLIDDNAKWLKQRSDDSIFPLNLEQYTARIDRLETEAEAFDKISDYDSNLTYESLPYEIALMESDTTLAEKRRRWHENLTKDVYIEEAINVLGDIQVNNITTSNSNRPD